jgi:two-component system heavy metal sensor histidine kinase CusS
MLRRALANLLANAIRHTPAGGSIRVGIAATDNATTLEIENSGEPIPPEHLSRIFDRFYRADPSRHRINEGAGLGLAITRSIVQRARWRDFRQVGDGGCVFRVADGVNGATADS